MRPPAQHLRARQQVHQVGVVSRAGLNGAPCEIVEAFVLAAHGGVERQLTAFRQVGAACGRLTLGFDQDRGDEQEDQEQVAQQ